MADVQNVVISGLAPNMPKWATDLTLQNIELEVKKLISIIQKKDDLKKVSTKKTQEEMDEFEKSLKDLNDEQNQTQDSIKKLRKSFGLAADDTADSLEKIKLAYKGGFTGMTNLTNAGEGLFSIFKNLASPAGLLGGTFTLASAALAGMIDYIKDTTQAMIGLYDTGLTFQNGLGDLRMAASTAAMPLDDFAKLMVKNSAVVKSFGTQGAQGFANVLKQTRELIRQQGYYGLSINQVNGYTSDYLEILRSQGVLTRMSDMERSSAAADYVKELTSFSQIMGKSREEINKQIMETMRNPELLAITGSLGPLGKQFTQTMQGIIGGLSGAGGEKSEKIIGDVVTMIGTLNGPMTDLYQGLLAAGRGDLAKQILDLSTDIKNNAIPLDVAQERLKVFMKGVQGLSQQDLQNLRNSTQVQGSALHDQAELIVSWNSNLQGLDLDKVTEKMVQEPDKFTEAVVKLSNLFQEMKGKIGVVFARFLEANQGALDRIMNNISDFAEYLAQKLSKVLEIIGNLIDPATRDKAIADIEDGIKSIVTTILQYMSDFISTKLYQISHGLVGESPAYVQAKQRYGANLAEYITDKDAQERYRIRQQGGIRGFLTGSALDDMRHDAFVKAATQAGYDPNVLLNAGPGPAPLNQSIMANAPAPIDYTGASNVQQIVDKQNEMFFKPALTALQTNNDLSAQNNQLTDQANDHLSSIKRSATTNPSIVRLQ